MAEPCPWRICFGLLPWIRNNQMENISFWLKNDHTLLLFSVRVGTEGFPVERYSVIGGHKETVTKFLLLQWPPFPRSSVCIRHPIAILNTSGLSCDLTFYFSSYWGIWTPKSCKDRWERMLWGLSVYQPKVPLHVLPKDLFSTFGYFVLKDKRWILILVLGLSTIAELNKERGMSYWEYFQGR